MKRIALFLIGILLSLSMCGRARGQGCGVTLEPHFSVYHSVARDGKNIYTTVSMQGYAYICGPCGCPQMNSATHRAAAENKLNNVDHWSYSGSSCPTCYYSVTDYEQIVGTPGVLYPWSWDGEAICSIVGGFWGSGSSGSLPGCLVPSGETTAVESTVYTTETAFNQTITDSAGDSFYGSTVTEGNSAPGQDTCYGTWSIGPRFTGIPTNPPSSWTVAGGQVLGQPNHWGFD